CRPRGVGCRCRPDINDSAAGAGGEPTPGLTPLHLRPLPDHPKWLSGSTNRSSDPPAPFPCVGLVPFVCPNQVARGAGPPGREPRRTNTTPESCHVFL